MLDCESKLRKYVLWFKFIFDFYFPLFQIMIMNTRQRKTKIKVVWKKKIKPKINLNHNICKLLC